MGIFYQEKYISHREKNMEKNDFARSENYSSYAPGLLSTEDGTCFWSKSNYLLIF